MTKDMQIVLDAIRSGTFPPDDMADSAIWAAERELERQGLIYRDERSGDLVAR